MFSLMSKIDFVEYLQNLMTEKDVSKADLDRKSGISAAQITRITTGEQGMSIDTLVETDSADAHRRASPVDNMRL